MFQFQLVSGIKGFLLLDVQALRICTIAARTPADSPDYLDSDDLVMISKILSTRLQETHRQSPQHMYLHTLTIVQVLPVCLPLSTVRSRV
jgi:hypothetical protein